MAEERISAARVGPSFLATWGEVGAEGCIVVTGRYNSPTRGSVQLRGTSGGRELTIPIQGELPADNTGNGSLIACWARQLTTGGVTRRIDVPVTLPQGVSHQGLVRDVLGGHRD